MIKKLVSHLGEYKRAAILTPILSALEAIMDVLLPTIMAFIIDQGIEKGDMNAVVKYGLLTFLVAAIALLLGVLAGRFAATASTGFAGNLRDAMYENIQRFSFSNIDKYSTAGLVTRMTTDVTNLQNAFQMIDAHVRACSCPSGLRAHHGLHDQPLADHGVPGGDRVPGGSAGRHYGSHLRHL